MGATRLASGTEKEGKYKLYQIIIASVPDAGRVARISACVWCLGYVRMSTKT